ncbi:MAG TPA: DinB family protein [Fimbriimonadaceae bacterium]|nr:DinB family protein [Fimbriimonadaceae bacterium]
MSDLKSHIRARIAEGTGMYIQDLEAMDAELLGKSPGGVARSAYDFTYEVVVVNRRVAARLRGDDPGPWPSEGWMTAPDDFKNKEVAVREMKASSEEVLAAWDALDAGAIETPIVLPTGETTPMSMASLIATHAVYHDAQLNYIQAIAGDGEMHWM